ncbi:MAG: Gfo/Idh/MocA family oxidoreductase [Acidobacteriota bacterium]
MSRISRRSSLVSTGLTVTAGAGERIQVAVVGVRSRGRDLIEEFARNGSRVAAVCDIDTAQIERAVQFTERLQGQKPKTYQDIRRLLEDKEIDVVAIATCNHWHALATIWACQAGKDVYVEKPASHNVWEGRRMVEAARKYRRIAQVGMQNRSLAHVRRAIELLHQGVIGKVYLAKGLCYKRRKSIGRQPDGPAPHVTNFLQAVRSRNPAQLTAGVLEGHLSAALCHLANISYRTGRSLVFDPVSETFPHDAEANSHLSRNYRAPFVAPATL